MSSTTIITINLGPFHALTTQTEGWVLWGTLTASGRFLLLFCPASFNGWSLMPAIMSSSLLSSPSSFSSPGDFSPCVCVYPFYSSVIGHIKPSVLHLCWRFRPLSSFIITLLVVLPSIPRDPIHRSVFLLHQKKRSVSSVSTEKSRSASTKSLIRCPFQTSSSQSAQTARTHIQPALFFS